VIFAIFLIFQVWADNVWKRTVVLVYGRFWICEYLTMMMEKDGWKVSRKNSMKYSVSVR